MQISSAQDHRGAVRWLRRNSPTTSSGPGPCPGLTAASKDAKKYCTLKLSPAKFQPVRRRVPCAGQRWEAMSDHSHEAQHYPADNPAVTAHISLLQGIINRLANNSASCKTWCLTLVGALLSLAGATHVPGIVTFALVAVAIFGLMDTMYLAEEMAYRDLYNSTVQAIRDGKYGRHNFYEARASLSLSNFISAVVSWSIFLIMSTFTRRSQRGGFECYPACPCHCETDRRDAHIWTVVAAKRP